MGFVCKRQGTWIKPPNQLNFTLTDTSCPDFCWFGDSLSVWDGLVGTRGAVWVQNLFKGVSSQCCCAGTAHGRGRETVTYRRNLPQTHTKPKPPAEGSLLRLPAQLVWGTQPGSPAGRAGTQHQRPQGLLCPGFVPVGLTHKLCPTSPLLSQHPPPRGISLLWTGRSCSSSALFCFVLSVQLPKTQSHKTQFTIPAAFWHPTVLAYRENW